MKTKHIILYYLSLVWFYIGLYVIIVINIIIHILYIHIHIFYVIWNGIICIAVHHFLIFFYFTVS